MPASPIDGRLAARESPKGEPDVIALAADADFQIALTEVIRVLSTHHF